MQVILKKIIFIFCVIVTNSLSAQKNVEFTKENFPNDKEGLSKAQHAIKTGDGFYEKGTSTYKQAIEPYLIANSFNPDNALLNFKIGKCYMHSNHKLKSLPYLEKACSINPNVDKYLHYYLGRSYHLNSIWEKAIQEYKTYQKTLDAKIAAEEIADLNRRIEECSTGAELMKNPVRIKIENAGGEINTSFPDYGTVISADESIMIFTSKRSTTTGGKKDEAINEYYEDIFISTKSNGKWTPATNMGNPINTEGHDASVGLSADGQTLLIYIDDSKGSGDIFECTQKGDSWSKPERFNSNINTIFHESSASLSADGRTLYFTSNKIEDNYGNHDIYKSTMDKKGKWGPAQNLGTVINTPYNEESVFFHPDGKTLYFSSEGHKTMGSFDIFKSVYENGKWSEPVNLGYPVNTPYHDVGFVLSANGKHGYYASLKDSGYGEKDIYMISFLGPEKPVAAKIEPQQTVETTTAVQEIKPIPIPVFDEVQISLTLLKGVITDELTQKPVEATIELVDNEKNEVIASFTSNSKTGRYLVSLPSGKNYGIAVKAEDYLFHSENFDIPVANGYQEITKNIALKNIAVGSTIVLKNIFFDFDKATLRPESFNELGNLISLLGKATNIRIEISGHTDNKGSAAYNQTLSESRAKTVVEYLVTNGVNKSRLEYKGYGLAQPIATNDTDEGRQMNRRTEFKILSK